MNATSQPGTNASIEVTICVYAIIKRGYFGKLFPESQMVGCKCQGSWSTAKVFSKMHKCVQVFQPCGLFYVSVLWQMIIAYHPHAARVFAERIFCIFIMHRGWNDLSVCRNYRSMT
jgi:hypothetical protein